MRRLLGVLVALALATSIGAVVAPTASAQGMTGDFGTLVMPDAKAPGTSRCASTTVSFEPNGSLVGWTLQLESRNPQGGAAGPAVLLTEVAPAQKITFCTSRHLLGTYEFTGGIHGQRAGQNSFPNEGYSGKVRFSLTTKVPSALAADVVRSRSKAYCPGRRTAHCSRVTASLTADGRPLRFGWVEIQAYRRGHWVRLGTGHAGGAGRVVWFATITSKQRSWKFRLHFAGTDLFKASSSRAFRLKY